MEKRYFIKPSGVWIECERVDYYAPSNASVPSVKYEDGALAAASGVAGYKIDGASWVRDVDSLFFGAIPIKVEEPKNIVDATIAERGLVYGDPYLSHLNIALSWTALLQQHLGITFNKPLPASLVAQMMVVFKMQRSAKVYKDDNYTDAHAYAKFADEFQKKEQNK
jgi:hypothetical protein